MRRRRIAMSTNSRRMLLRRRLCCCGCMEVRTLALPLQVRTLFPGFVYAHVTRAQRGDQTFRLMLRRRLQVVALPPRHRRMRPLDKHVQDAYGATARHTALKMRLQMRNMSVGWLAGLLLAGSNMRLLSHLRGYPRVRTLTIPRPQSHTGCLIQCLDHLSKRRRQPDHTELILFFRAIVLKGTQQTGHHQ